ncbi:ABC transporter substrate-binding protein [Bacillus mycoides]|uniref:ABC transporter substrate-binding protein n=1 Tax=Bacillus mycoides TaxID=1405 RepID=A0ABX6Z8I1_BACMY|nr:ABC transporter substrate-binding protein [Bacillus mycoides]AJH20830.1 bacterial extracellular solute-binding s, 5 Middle family protein [Bacillus mycoides]EEM01403.1 Oligopeptide transporter, periplasmic-binding protein [Bacillus mycoides DSM 2048]MDR4236676.1 ABC transporter substrate-binding protein [Bacillus mycoides]MED1425766.1 ABC transporter substrate-binding protein [Bacillus mycoides]MED1486574.1 ABC transporter substrate-binding protein [Bacillus mycoides]
MRKVFKGLLFTFLSTSVLLAGCAQEETSTNEATKMPKVKDEFIKASDKAKSPAKAKERKDTFVVGMPSPGGIFLPHFMENGWDGNITQAIFAPLVGLDKEGKPIPILAKKWDISEDQLTYTFHLKDDLKFSDSSPLTADDVAFTLTLLHDPTYSGATDISQTAIKGGQAYKEGKATSIEGIQVIDPKTITITTEKVNAQTLSLIGGEVISKAYYGKEYKQGNLEYLKELYGKPMGAGAYKLDKYIPGQEVRFVANENYFEGKPKIEHFIYKITKGDTKLQQFQAGEVDYDGFTTNAETIEQLKELGFANVNVYTGSSYGYIKMNYKKSYFKDKRVRQAFIYGLERQKVIDTYFQGYASLVNVPITPVSWAYTEEGINKYEYNLEKAKKLLDEAGWKAGSDGIREKDGQKLKVSYFASSASKINDVMIPVMKEDYKKIGVDFNPEYMDFNTMISKVIKGDYDLAMVSTPMIDDPSGTIEEFVSTSKRNYDGYHNPKVNELAKQALETLDIEKRKEIYKKLYQELSEDPPVIFLNNSKVVSAHNARIQGLQEDNYNGILLSLPKLNIAQ